MPDPMKPEFTAQNPIVAAAEKIRARRTVEAAADGEGEIRREFDDAESGLRAFAKSTADGIVRINAIIGERDGIRLVSLEKPLRLRIRFKDKRIALEADSHQGDYALRADTRLRRSDHPCVELRARERHLHRGLILRPHEAALVQPPPHSQMPSPSCTRTLMRLSRRLVNT